MTAAAEREAVFHPEFRQDFRYWVEADRKTALRVLELVRNCPSRSVHRHRQAGAAHIRAGGLLVARITQEHRLVYKVSGLDFLQPSASICLGLGVAPSDRHCVVSQLLLRTLAVCLDFPGHSLSDAPSRRLEAENQL